MTVTTARKIVALLAGSVILGALLSHAAITSTNLLPFASYSSGVSTGAVYLPPQTHYITPQTYSIYHSSTNIAFPTTNYLEITFDGGRTWATAATYVNSTNTMNDVWQPDTSAMVASNRVRVVTTTNQTLNIQANWVQ